MILVGKFAKNAKQIMGSKGLKDALRKKQLIASFVEQFKLNLENIRCIDFQFHVAKGAVDSFSCRAS